MRCWMSASSGAPTTTATFSEGKLRHLTLCTFSAAWFSIDGSLTTSTTICPAPRTFCSERKQARQLARVAEMGVAWS